MTGKRIDKAAPTDPDTTAYTCGTETAPDEPTTCDHCPNPVPANDALCEPCKWAHYYDVDRARDDEWYGEVSA